MSLKANLTKQNYLFLFILMISFLLLFFFNKNHILLLINGINTPFWDQFFKYYTYLGSALGLILILIPYLFKRFQFAASLVAGFLISSVFIQVFKRLLFTDFDRPPKVFEGQNLLHFAEGVNSHFTRGFPSGHTTTAFVVATIVALNTKNKWIQLIALSMAIMVGFSRIYLAQHFYMDVVAGAWLGYISAWIGWAIFEDKKHLHWAQRKMHF